MSPPTVAEPEAGSREFLYQQQQQNVQIYREYSALRRQRRRRRCCACFLLAAAVAAVPACSMLATLSKLHPAQSHPKLQMKADGTFRLAQFCDLHFGERDEHDTKSVQFQRKLLELESPDLVVIDGDASSNYAAPFCPFKLGCQNFFREQWLKFTAVFQETATPYAYTLGNHDRIPAPAGPGDPMERSYAVPDHWILQLDTEFNSMSVAKDGPSDIHGASNYVVPILGQDGRPVFYIWLLDSSDNDCLGIHGWGCVYPDQVEWYKRASKRLIDQDGRVVPGLMFHHIPLPEVLEAWNDYENTKLIGTLGEQICCFSSNTGLFDAIKEMGNVEGVFHGHDHNNDFIAFYKDLVIGFGRKSGYGGYGGPVADRPGSRVFEIHQDQHGRVSWETWIRLETGEKLVQEPVPPDQRAGQFQFRQCCGMADPQRTSTAAHGNESMEFATQACRLQDDAHMCRVASGISPLVPSLVSFL